MTRFTLKQLKYFVTVVETESIAEASRQLHIAQPSISIAIKNLESTFDQQLFIRHHAQGVSLTSSGRRFYDKAKELLRLSYEFEQNTRADKELVSGTISVGCFESVAPLYMPRLVAGFKKMYPEITLKLYDGEQHELMHGLHRGRFDLALVYDLELGSSISKELLNAPHKPYALLPASHPLASKKSVTLQELSREPMILLDAVPSKNYFITIFKEKGYNPVVAYSSPSIEMVRCMVGQGLGFSVLVTRPHSDITYDGEVLKQLDIEDDMPDSTLIMAHLANNEPTRPVKLFIDYCRSIELTHFSV
ncbi:LysR substrate-binding domain-containing protein [Serratia proteamaculans]|uniref:LysR substrate-binding domain-containing protein n=1 Tax=Serratia proteamaculans TaxID=28151 RepID=UPI002179A173|nr:LysR substrate-binding domain-containing protein [Serratia proteamaculans]CAI0979371.1 HTH-type transcriptional regulator gltC [Serratia proteamaculans]CAI1687748.1 HTH-type transcriptional regulator gltC [Serratia proteamaculans]CAI1699625.1 HTH-type transcriptional regulator gltC [Serratia proteamaculans]CAI1984527.1 HTH-type transcriptional regulator gltC [Serratia proteamaculans]